MDDQRFGSQIRLLRIRRGWRQQDLAAKAGVGRWVVGTLERGGLATIPLAATRLIAQALDVRVDVIARWRGGDLGRLMNAGHAAMHVSVAELFRSLPEWITEPEVSFSILGERGVIDVIAWHPGRRALLIIELKRSSSTSMT